jgi:hypothetical protein
MEGTDLAGGGVRGGGHENPSLALGALKKIVQEQLFSPQV